MGAKKQRKIIFPKKFFDIKNEKRIKIWKYRHLKILNLIKHIINWIKIN
jgi:hypothetical protein